MCFGGGMRFWWMGSCLRWPSNAVYHLWAMPVVNMGGIEADLSTCSLLYWQWLPTLDDLSVVKPSIYCIYIQYIYIYTIYRYCIYIQYMRFISTAGHQVLGLLCRHTIHVFCDPFNCVWSSEQRVYKLWGHVEACWSPRAEFDWINQKLVNIIQRQL